MRRRLRTQFDSEGLLPSTLTEDNPMYPLPEEDRTVGCISVIITLVTPISLMLGVVIVAIWWLK